MPFSQNITVLPLKSNQNDDKNICLQSEGESFICLTLHVLLCTVESAYKEGTHRDHEHNYVPYNRSFL